MLATHVGFSVSIGEHRNRADGRATDESVPRSHHGDGAITHIRTEAELLGALLEFDLTSVSAVVQLSTSKQGTFRAWGYGAAG
jgi:hypothetical protein